MEKTIKIFVPNFAPSNDYTAAQEIGELVFMTRGILMDDMTNLHEKFRKYFATAEDGDILMFSGSHVACASAYAEWCERFPISRNVAVYDKKKNSYQIQTILA